MSKKWTVEEVQKLKKMCDNGYSLKEICEKLNMSKDRVKNKLYFQNVLRK